MQRSAAATEAEAHAFDAAAAADNVDVNNDAPQKNTSIRMGDPVCVSVCLCYCLHVSLVCGQIQRVRSVCV